MEDGLILMYVKDGVIYPVALTQEQVATFKVTQTMLPGKVRVIISEPVGEAVNLLEKG